MQSRATTARIVFDAVIQLRRRTNSLIDSFPPFHATAEKLLGSAHYPRRARFTGVEFVFRFIFHETGDYATTPTYNSISLFDFSSLYVSVSPSFSPSAYAPAPPQETYTLLLPLPPRWIHEVKARRGIEGSRLLVGQPDFHGNLIISSAIGRSTPKRFAGCIRVIDDYSSYRDGNS